MSDIWLLRIGIVIAGVLLMAAIYFFGRPGKPKQGRKLRDDGAERPHREPSLADAFSAETSPYDTATLAETSAAEPPASGPDIGRRDRDEFDKIVTLYVAARADQVLRGPDIVVAAEKAGLSYGYMNIFHRLADGRADGSPIFSVANIKKPGSFEMHDIHGMETPAIAFFLTLPAPIPALDAWEKMLPTAQRMAELLDGVVLDESRNPIGRQRIAHLRDELRAYDRQHEAPPVSRNTRW
ncbi:cell division protein ZipA [Lysobacter brunescens]|uniref:Cell division protein ZipA n=1 Tax=Lysobacter brunescens TaxID=262323 RepID=A0ABW2YFQ7_9GAMM